jgi:hypothetical protein
MFRTIPYEPDSFEALRQAVAPLGRSLALQHRPFVDYYYASRPSCRLFLLVDDHDAIAGTIGIDLLPFQAGARTLVLGFSSNFNALRPGAGAYLYVTWMRACEMGVNFGGSPDFHRLIRRQGWTYFPRPAVYYLNAPFTVRATDPWWLTAAKRGAKWCTQRSMARRARRIDAAARRRVTVQEELAYDESLLPARSPFSFRFAPDVEYLRWRYALDLPFVRYRLFRVLDGGVTAGYVVVKDDDPVLVAQCDGDDPLRLALGVVLALLRVCGGDERPRGILLAAAHPAMVAVYERFGFRPKRPARPFALGGFRRGVDVPADTASWHINFDLGDNGLRTPFRDQTRLAGVRAAVATPA